MHLLKGNVGSGVFAMGDAFKNGGIILGTLLTLYLGLICVHCQHILVRRITVSSFALERDQLTHGTFTAEMFAKGERKIKFGRRSRLCRNGWAMLWKRPGKIANVFESEQNYCQYIHLCYTTRLLLRIFRIFEFQSKPSGLRYSIIPIACMN